ncbi:BRAP2 RING ZnF UBP domain-containing protein 1 isoform X2 [Macadamia integrifolia]|uniref:BRAP2 RING ZnF UBP domain-containing protein 1 isoform X2 n=1 Tax=Macadamia integrifolia TaxID=60698 RepID=UPI001C52C940|nr:BRAP2 RING ZnF UBP domain-containing protein 1 isoform X2 [Macadamia integrifolia]
MFRLQIHSVDTNHLITTRSAGEDSGVATPTNPNFASSNPYPNIQERRGIVHLFRSVSCHDPTSLSTNRNDFEEDSTFLFVVAVPNHLSLEDLISFCASYINHFSEVLIIRNDGMEDRYSVLIKLVDQQKSESFYWKFNGRRFSSTEAEVCHILYVTSVEYTESSEIASTPPQGFTELPTCPVCLERLDQDTSGILTTPCDHSFQCSCISKWADSSCLVCRFCQKQAQKPTCSVCGTSEDLWICMICGFVGCGRYKEGHAIKHWKETKHCYSLDLETQRVWDYVGDNYVHRLNHSKTDGKLVELNSCCILKDGDCGNCDYSEDSGISSALFSSKVDIVDEYNRLLTSQLETQREYYETLLVEVRGKKEKSISEAVEKALFSKQQEIQLKYDKCIEEKRVAADRNENLMTKQKLLQKEVKEAEERAISFSKLKDDKIVDLEEQIRDLRVYIEAQRTLDTMTGSDDIKGGTILPVPLQQSTSGSTKRSSKVNRRRN